MVSGVPALKTRLYCPYKVIVRSESNGGGIYVSDPAGPLYMIDRRGILHVLGWFSTPTSLAWADEGADKFYLTELSNHGIRVMAPPPYYSTIAGSGMQNPWGVSSDGGGGQGYFVS